MRAPLRAGAWVCATLVLAACGTAGPAGRAVDTVAVEPSAVANRPSDVPHGAWEPVARSPLSARSGSSMVWTGTEVLVLGGGTDYPCKTAGPSCVLTEAGAAPRRQGAAYDPAVDRWRATADAPSPISVVAGPIDGIVYALAIDGNGETLLAYDVDRDRWTELPGPGPTGEYLIAVGRHLVVYRAELHHVPGGRDRIWDADEQVWEDLPPAPAEPSAARRMVTANGRAFLVGSTDPNRSYLSERVAVAELDPGSRRWSPLDFGPGNDGRELAIMVPHYVHSAAGKVVTASPAGDRVDDHLVGGILDPDTGWSRLPERPDAPRSVPLKGHVPTLHWLNVGGDEFVVAGRWAYDAAAGTWQHVPIDKGPLRQNQSSAVWAGDRVFVWGGSKRGDSTEHLATGWTWKPLRSTTGSNGSASSGGEGASG
ncbi:MAG: hypothetical protein ACT4QF_10450 [Sporichthyaceae bacterium]